MSLWQLLTYALGAVIGLPYYMLLALWRLLRGDTDGLAAITVVIPLYVRALLLPVYVFFLLASCASLMVSLYLLHPGVAAAVAGLQGVFVILIVLVGYAPRQDTRHLQAAGVQYVLLFNGFWQTVLWALFSHLSYHEPFSVLSLLMAGAVAYLNSTVVLNTALDERYRAQFGPGA
ncbi:MAG: hypothetical protein MUE40_20150 [Anaerolineae bacterium]|jgi:uncharacterized membrane protein|nr:hypothetical protein [Anaerolineae bacterium]